MLQKLLINSVSASLLRAPDFHSPHDPLRLELMDMLDSVTEFDSEFVLKVCSIIKFKKS
jgi:hypothetical protein